MNASSHYNTSYLPTYGRLYDVRRNAWCAKTASASDDWLQVDAGNILVICAVSTQGDVRGNDWVTEFKLSYSLQGLFWNSYSDRHGNELVSFHVNKH